MSLSPGTRLGPYDVVGPLGAGGMGEVYRARDPKLRRDVAIKVLPVSFATDPDRVARFEREAQVLATLNHPHIAAIYGLEDSDGQLALAMELVEGVTVAERLQHGALPLEEAMDWARQIAQAMDAAHARGVIHRDLKPSNIKVTPGGHVKVLDFGLAKFVEPPGGSWPERALADSPTITSPAAAARGFHPGTELGLILGTAAYMAPEQARGRAADRQADVWAFGCVLYEMLTGMPPFRGDDVTEVLGAVLHKEPDWTVLPAATPLPIRRLLRRCLQKPLDRRLHSLADALLDIDEALTSPAEQAAVVPRSRWPIVLSWALTAAFGLAWLFSLLRSDGSTPAAVSKLALALPQPVHDSRRPVIALSPDGTQLAFVADDNGVGRIYVRPVDAFEAVPLSGTEGAISIFFAPGGEWIGFYADGRLRKISTRGGPAQTLASATDFLGGSWSPAGTIIASFAVNQLFAIPEGGGAPTPLPVTGTRLEGSRRLPHVLPDGRAVLFTIRGPSSPLGSVAVYAFDSGEERVLITQATNPSYVDGFLLFARSGTLFAVPFDSDRLTVVGTPVPVLEGLLYDAAFATAHYVVSKSGRLAYLPGSAAAGRLLATIDRNARVSMLSDSRRAYYMPRVSPDGSRLALTILDDGQYSVWVMDLARGSLSQLATNAAAPVWSPDGQWIAYASSREPGTDLTVSRPDGGATRVIAESSAVKVPTSWSPDGRWIAVTWRDETSGTGEDIYFVAPDGSGMRPFLETAANESGGVFSPDGRWLAYSSSADRSVQISSIDAPEVRWRADASGGTMPIWSHDGTELFFLAGPQVSQMMSVQIATEGDGLRISAPALLFERVLGSGFGFSLSRYDVMHDGRFVFATAESAGPANHVRIVLDWREQIARTVR